MPFITSDGVRTYYEEHGSGEPLVLVAGFGMTISAWSEQLDAFARHFRVILLELRGAGPSEVPEPGYTNKDLAQDVVVLMDSLQLKRAHFGGFSLGGGVGMELAIAHPDRVATLALHSSWDDTDQYPHMINWINVRRRIIAENDPVVNVGTRIVSFFSPDFINRRQDRVRDYIERAKSNPHPMTPKGIAGHEHALMAQKVRGRLDGIRCPTLITVGSADRSTLPSASRYLRDNIQDSELILIDGAGHCTMFEAASEFTTIYLGFLLKHGGLVSGTGRSGAR